MRAAITVAVGASMILHLLFVTIPSPCRRLIYAVMDDLLAVSTESAMRRSTSRA